MTGPVSRLLTVLLATAGVGGLAHAAMAQTMAVDLPMAASAQRFDPHAVDTLYARIMASGEPLEMAVDRMREGKGAGQAERGLTIAGLYWRHGLLGKALDETDRVLALMETPEAFLLKARLLDASGKAEEARRWYEKALGGIANAREREFIRLRLTMIDVDSSNIDALLRFAAQRDQTFKNRAAVIAALLGHPKTAISLYRPDDAHPFNSHVRLAEWAVEVGAYGQAQDEAWKAYRSTQVRGDRLYALSILAEAHRNEGSLPALTQRLATVGAGDEDLLRLRIDILGETNDYESAIALFDRLGHSVASEEARHSLINLYKAADRPKRIEQEYLGLIRAEPSVARWYGELAAHYLVRAEPEAASAVWERFERANAGNVPVIVEGARIVAQMGEDRQATAMVERALAARGDNAEALLFLFDLHLKAGRNGDARGVLARLDTLLPAGSSDRRRLADAYERLGEPVEALRVYKGVLAAQGGSSYDDKARIAWLNATVGQKAEALATWREIWLSVDNPARRSLAESQMLLLAAELGRIGDIAVEIEQRLYDGTASRNEINLLVRLYTEVGDSFSASEVIEEFARSSKMGEVEKLEQLGAVYRQIEDYRAYDRVLRRLFEIDPAHRAEHVQSIILNLLANDLLDNKVDKDVTVEIETWLDRLRELGDGIVTAEFEASIFAMAGLNDRAIESYRRAYARDPENGDNLLLMTDLMKKSDRQGEAVATLQYVAEHTASDNVFVVAVDGIINTIGQRTFGDPVSPENKAIFDWTHRLLLERIASRPEQFYLYSLLAEIAEETNHRERQFLALESSLSQAGSRRPAILRELITLSTESSGFGGLDTGAGDPERKLRYGRRLVALDQVLPPEVYVGIAQTLLDRGDRNSASKALDRVFDVTGQTKVDETKAKLFEAAGYRDAALEAYSRALVRDRDNLDLITRNAVLREGVGQDDVANGLYVDALLELFAAQPQLLRNSGGGNARGGFGPDAADPTVTREFQQYHEALVQGALITWPEGGSGATARFEALFDTELAEVASMIASGEQARLDRFSRLRQVSEFLMRLARARKDEALARRVTEKLRAHFTIDPAMGNSIDSIAQREKQVEGEGDFETRLERAKLAGNDDAIVSMLLGKVRDGALMEALAHAELLLKGQALKRFLTAVAIAMDKDDKALKSLLMPSPAPLVSIERTLGRRILTREKLTQLISPPSPSSAPQSAGFTMVAAAPKQGPSQELPPFGSLWTYLDLANASIDEKLAALERFAGNTTSLAAFPQDALASLLAQPLDEGQKARVRVMWMRAPGNERGDARAGGEGGQYFILDAALSNVDLLLDLAGQRRDAQGRNAAVADILREFYRGDRSKAFADTLNLVRREGEGRSDSALGWRLRNGEYSKQFGAHAIAFLKRLPQGGQVDAATAMLAYQARFSSGFGSPVEPRPAEIDSHVDQVKLLAALVDTYPDYRPLRDMAVSLFVRLGENARAAAQLRAMYKANPDDGPVRTVLFVHEIQQQEFAAALEIARDGGEDLTNPRILEHALKSIHDPMVNEGRGWPVRFLAGIPAEEPLAQILRESRQPDAAAAAPRDRLFDEARAALAEEKVENARRALRLLWRGTTLDEGDGAARRFAIAALSDPASYRAAFAPQGGKDAIGEIISSRNMQDGGALPEALARAGAAPAEFERYLRAVPANERAQLGPLYDALADAYGMGGGLEARLTELTGALRGGNIDNHDLAVWLALNKRSDGKLDPQDADILSGYVASAQDIGDLQRLWAARLLGRSGRVDEAVSLYRQAAMKRIDLARLTGFRNVERGGGSVTGGPTLLEIARDVGTALPREAALPLMRALIAATPHGNSDTEAALYAALALEGFSYILPPESVLAEVERMVPRLASLSKTNAAVAVLLASVQARAGNVREGLSALRAASGHSETQEIFEPREHALAALYGVDLQAGEGAPNPLIQYRERLFPSKAEPEWPAARAWTIAAGRAALDWALDAGIAPAKPLEMALVAAIQLHRGGDVQAARAMAEEAQARVLSHPERFNGHDRCDVALVALETGARLDLPFAGAVLADGLLDGEREGEMVRQLAGSAGAARTLDMLKGISRNSLGIMRAALAVAETAGDKAYGEALTQRIERAKTDRGALKEIVPEGGE